MLFALMSLSLVLHSATSTDLTSHSCCHNKTEDLKTYEKKEVRNNNEITIT